MHSGCFVLGDMFTAYRKGMKPSKSARLPSCAFAGFYFEFAPFFRRNKPSGTPDGAIFRKEDTLFFTAAFTADHLPRRLSLPEAAPTVVSRA